MLSVEAQLTDAIAISNCIIGRSLQLQQSRDTNTGKSHGGGAVFLFVLELPSEHVV